ncbi:MAG: hypothetical protein WCJ19_03205 [bacterium]
MSFKFGVKISDSYPNRDPEVTSIGGRLLKVLNVDYMGENQSELTNTGDRNTKSYKFALGQMSGQILRCQPIESKKRKWGNPFSNHAHYALSIDELKTENGFERTVRVQPLPLSRLAFIGHHALYETTDSASLIGLVARGMYDATNKTSELSYEFDTKFYGRNIYGRFEMYSNNLGIINNALLPRNRELLESSLNLLNALSISVSRLHQKKS